MAEGGLRLLVKTRRGSTSARLAVGKGGVQLSLIPLMPSIDGSAGKRLSAARAASSTWHLALSDKVNVNPWDACHALLRPGFGVQGGDVEFAEPDLSQQWFWESRERLALGLTQSCAAPDPPKGPPYSTGAPYWHLSAEYSQLAKASDAVPVENARVRIAHLDTGYNKDHHANPAHFLTNLQKNFADDDRGDDATDLPTAVINPMFGHGTGTLSLLAGKLGDQMIGGACNLEVVPIRVANWVVLFKNSAIAQAFDYVHSLSGRPETKIDVVTMSMGGLASQAWADAVNALYEAGIVVVTAAGNNFGNLPTHNIVYPARFDRVIAACGVMSDGRPYADLPLTAMAGCYGPAKKMKTALTAYTPNTPWARFGCPDIVDLDGGGTSAATPQIAAAAALWIQKNKAALDRIPADEAWRKVEAVRKALFDKANKKDSTHFGQGLLKSFDALSVPLARAGEVQKLPPDDVSFPLLRVLTGLGVEGQAAVGPRQRMVELEAIQLSQRSREVEQLLGDLDPGDPELRHRSQAKQILQALADHPQASQTLKSVVAAMGNTFVPPPAPAAPPAPPGGGRKARGPVAPPPAGLAAASPVVTAGAPPEPVQPPARRLRVFAFDPILRTRLDTLALNEATLAVRWEKNLAPGPVGEYLEVVDVDPAANRAYAPVDLNHPHLLAQDGLTPTEGNPQFHQQMAYAVAMKTIEHFEKALGRVALWADRRAVVNGVFDYRFVRRLRIYPHALAEANAYYTPEKHALLFGYFPASKDNPGDNLPGGLVFSCLSHDIVAHETTHALLDGLHPFFREASNVDMLAFHEAFADIVALFQHFTLPEALGEQIRKSRGDLSVADLLGGLALQFGQAIGNRGALRSAIARFDDDKQRWEKIKPSPGDYGASDEPHEHGAILVAAVFDAFLQVYMRKTQDLMRLATGGTGVLPQGEIPYDLSERLAKEAARIAGHVLTICIRALDYCPPFDLTFGEYLRALVTADRDLVPADDDGYRVAFISAFRSRGIYPNSVRNLSVEGLAWDKPYNFEIGGLRDVLNKMSMDWRLESDRYEAFKLMNDNAAELHREINKLVDRSAAEANLGVFLWGNSNRAPSVTIGGQKGVVSKPMLTVRPCRRVSPSGSVMENVAIEITQRWTPANGDQFLRGGCTIIVDARGGGIKYVIGKHLASAARLAAQRDAAQRIQAVSGYANFWTPDTKEPFAMLHRGY